MRNLGYAFTLEAVDKSINIGIPILNMIGSVIALATVIETGGASEGIWKATQIGLTIIQAEWTLIYNSLALKLYFSNEKKLLEKVPTSLASGTIKLVCLSNIDNKIVKTAIEVSVDIVDGCFTLNLKDNGSTLEKLSDVFTIIGIIDNVGNDVLKK